MAGANLVDIPFAFLPAKWIYSARRLYAGLMELDNAGTKSSKSELKPLKVKLLIRWEIRFKVITDRMKEVPAEIFSDISQIMAILIVREPIKSKMSLLKSF